MGSARAWPRSGDAKFSAADGRRAGSGSPFSCRASTPAPDPPSGADDFRFPRQYRLTRGADVEAVAREGKRLRTAHLDVRVVASPRDHCRVGFVVAKYGHSAVERNRVKRMLRELARRRLLGALRQLKAGTTADVVLRAKPEAYRATLSILAAEFDGLAARIARVVAPSAPTMDTADTRSAGNS